MSSFKPREVVKILKKLGFFEKRQKGSHLILYSSKLNKSISVPIHRKDMRKGLLQGIIKEVKSTEKEFLRLK